MALTNNTALVELGPEARKSLRKLASSLDLGEYDLLLIGDGSGTTYREPAGWSCIAYEPARKQAVIHAGAFTAGTNNVAELMPYLHALYFHDQEHKGEPMEGCRVAIVSDSEVTVRCGNRLYGRHANGCWWAGIESFEKQGYSFHWHHVLRSSNVWNQFADALAGASRKAAVTFKNGIELAFEQAVPMLAEKEE